jgi:mycothiol synthase
MTTIHEERSAARVDGMPADVPPVLGVPEIAGIRFRGLVRPDDYPALAELGNVTAEADGIRERNSAEELANWIEHDPKRDLARDVILVEVDGAVIASAMGGWELDNDGGHNYGTWGAVLPAWRRRGIGTALLRWVEARQRQFAQTHAPGIAKRLQSWAYGQEQARIALLERHGYEIVRYWFEMERPDLNAIPDVPLPEGFTFRPGPKGDPREVWDVVVSAFKDHFGGMDDSEEAYQGHLSDPNRDPSLWVLVEHEGRIVGTALNRISRAENEALGVKRGRVNAVAVLRDYRRRGLGRSIVAESLRVLRKAGMSSATLGVDAQNPHGALGLYESLGFAVVEEGRIYRKPLES